MSDNIETEKMNTYKVKYQEQKFKFMTFKNPFLKTIQFWLIKSEIEQAVGRARLLREKAQVTVFSNFPVEQSKRYKLEKFLDNINNLV